MSKEKKTISALNVLLVIQLIFMFGLSIGITQIISQSTTDSSVDYMTAIAYERSQMVLSYVENVKATLSEYSRSGEISEVIKHPSDSAAVSAAQQYTERFSGDIKNLEGIYVSEWNTHVLAHTNVQTAGIVTRTGDSLKELQDAVTEAGDGVYDTGIIISPATGRQIVSMYKAVYNEAGEPAGLVGIGIYTEGLVEILDSLRKNDMKKSFYSMVNVSDKKYIFNNDEAKISSEADNSALKALCDSLSGSDDATGYFRYSLNGEKYISIYSYVAEKGWLFMMDDTESEIFALTNNMQVYLVVFCIFCTVLIVIFNLINKKQEETSDQLEDAVIRHAKTKESLNTAVFNDILTNTRNRVSFSNDFEPGKIDDLADSAYYFAMFNISGFSNVNIVYGEEAGDMVLTATADTLRELFEGSTVYRTGSDEFVAVVKMPKNTVGFTRFKSSIEKSIGRLMKPYNMGNGSLSVAYKVSAVCKSRNIDSSVLPALKNMINLSGSSGHIHIGITDMDTMSR